MLGFMEQKGLYSGSDQTLIYHVSLIPSPLQSDGLSQREKLHVSNILEVKWAPWLRAVHRPL